MTCALCRVEKELRCSHIIPSFVFSWLKESSGTGYLRFGRSPNLRVQDGLKQDLLCNECEGLFSRWETEFANKLFFPLHQNDALRLRRRPWFRYGPWCLKFAASVAWRCLSYMRQVGGLNHFSEPQLEMADGALETWRAFLLGSAENPQAYEQHMVLSGGVADHTCHDLPKNFNRYLLRTVGFDACRTDTSAFVHVKMCRVMLFGFIQEPNKSHWRGTKLRLRQGEIGGTDFVLPGPLLGYLRRRATRLSEIEGRLSPQQLGKIQADSERKLDRLIGSETLSAAFDGHAMSEGSTGSSL